MKKTYILVAALVMAASAGCDKAGNVDVPAEGPETIYMSFTADAPPAPCGDETKVGISGDHNTGYRTRWEDDDAVGVRVCQLKSDGSFDSDGSISSFFAYTKDAGFKINKNRGEDDKATFTGRLEKRKELVSGEKYAVAAVYPFASPNNNKIPSSQTMDGASFDRSAALMISKLQYVEKISKNNPTSYEALEFIHVGTFLNVYVKELSASSVSGDETVKTVTVTASGKDMAGTVDSFNFGRVGDNPAKRTDLVNMKENYTSPSITVNVPDGTLLKNLSAMAVAVPFSLKDEYFTIAIETDRHSLQKTLKLTRDFESGRMTAIGFKVDKTFDAKPYIKVRQTDLSLSYFGEKRTFEIDANVPWSVDTESLPEGLTVEKVGETLNVTPPASTHFGNKKYSVKLEGNNGVTSTLEFIQPSIWEVNGACEVRADGSVLLGKASSALEPQLKLKEKVTYYGITYNITDAKGFTDETSPMVSVKTEAGAGKYLVEFRMGGGEDGNIYLVGRNTFSAKPLAASAFNELNQIHTSIGTIQAANSKILHLDLQWNVNDGGLLTMNDGNQMADSYWPSGTQGDLTFTLKNRGGGSFVISSYNIYRLSLGDNK